MKHVQLFAALILALVLAACGGSGSSTSSNPGTVLAGQPRIEAVLSDPTIDPNYSYQDLLNIVTNQQLYFQIVNYTTDASGKVTRNVLPSSNWSLGGTDVKVATITGDAGLFVAKGQPTTVNQLVSATWNGQSLTANWAITPRQVTLRGQLLAEGTVKPLAPVQGVQIEFYGPQDPTDPASPLHVVSRVTTAWDGTFRVSIPESSTAFQILNQSIPAGYYRSFLYKGSRYDTGVDSCRAPLAVFTSGDRTMIDPTNTDETQNGTIVLTPTALYPTLPMSTGCTP